MTASNSNGWVQTVSELIKTWIQPIFEIGIYLRVPVTIAIVASLIFTKVDQTIEVYRAIASDSNKFYEASVTVSSVLLLTIFIWYVSRFLILEQGSRFQNGLANWTPRILGIIPILSLVLGILKAWNESINDQARSFLMIWMISSLSTGITIFFLLWKRTDLFHRCFLGSKSQGEELFAPQVEIGLANVAYTIFSTFSLPLIAAAADSRAALGVIIVFGLSVLLNLILYSWHSHLAARIVLWWIASISASAIFVIALPSTVIPNAVGAVSVIAIALTTLVVVFSTIYYWAFRNNVPALTILLGLVAISSLLNLNDNHRFRQIATSDNSPLPSLEASFQIWLASRPDRDQYSGKPYPVYIASAQGGGIFAAYHAATTFAHLTESILSFPQHLFTISSVSGGSLGSAAYASLLKTGEEQNLSEKASQFFEQELLSPLLTLGFFPDLIQRFIPFPIYDWDRATGLELAFENSWNQLGNNRENPLKQSFYKHWQPQGIAPALVFNSTIVENGKRLVISPFEIVLPTQERIALNESQLDLRLSTAAVLSARFPFVTPVGWFQRKSDGSKLRLADGGYFDNSGIPTALDIGRALQKVKGYGKSFELIYLAIVDQPQVDSGKPLKSAGMNEILSPIRALFSAREARSASAIELSTYTLNDGITDPFKLRFRTLMLEKVNLDQQIRLPLGWQLSTASKEFIFNQIPAPSQCNATQFRQILSRNTSNIDVKNHNSCVAKSIESDLS